MQHSDVRASRATDADRRALALRLSLGAVALAALLSLALTRHLPTRALAEGDVAAAQPAAA
jgi:hypothetical protein